MTAVNIHEAKTHLSRLLADVERGREVIITRSGKPVAKLVPVGSDRPRRTAGALRGQIWIASDFDDPLPDDVLDEFES